MSVGSTYQGSAKLFMNALLQCDDTMPSVYRAKSLDNPIMKNTGTLIVPTLVALDAFLVRALALPRLKCSTKLRVHS